MSLEAQNFKNTIQQKEKLLEKEVVNEDDLQGKIEKIEAKIAKSSLAPEYKEQVRKELQRLKDEHLRRMSAIRTKTKSALNGVVDKFSRDLDIFESKDEVKAIFDVVNEPEYANVSKLGEKIQTDIQKTQEALDQYISHILSSGESARGHEADIEKYMLAHQIFLESLGIWINTAGQFAAKDPQNTQQRMKLLKSLLGKNERLHIPVLQGDKNMHGGMKRVTVEMSIPDSQKELESMKNAGKREILHLRATIYRITGNKQYEKYFEEYNQQIDTNILNEGLDTIGKVQDITPNDKPLQEWALEKIGELSSTFQALQMNSAKDPIGTQHAAKAFLERLNAFANGYQIAGIDEGKGSGAFQMALAKHQKLKMAFEDSIKKYSNATEDLIVETLTHHQLMREHRQNVSDVVGRTNIYIQSIQKLFEQVQKTGNEPSKTTMAMFHEEARKILNDRAFNALLSSPAIQFIENLDLPDEHVSPRLHAKIRELQAASSRVKEYLHTVNVITREVMALKGHGVGALDFFRDAGKYTAITAAAVAGATIAGTAIVASGGLAAGPIASFMATTVATSLGATIGSHYATAAIEGNTDTIDTKGMLESWGQGAVFSGGGVLAGQALGTGLGKGADAFAKAFNIAPGKILTAPTIKEGIATSGLKGYLKQVMQETSEEIFEDTVQKIGEGLAPSEPWLGFIFSLIPSAIGRARQVLHSAGMERKITNNGIEITYDNPKVAAKALEELHAPQQVVEAVQLGHTTVVSEDGLNITVRGPDISDMHDLQRRIREKQYSPQTYEWLDELTAAKYVTIDEDGKASWRNSADPYAESLVSKARKGDMKAKSIIQKKVEAMNELDRQRDKAQRRQTSERLVEFKTQYGDRLEPLKVEDLVVVHATRYAPNERMPGQFEIQTSFDATDGRFIRNSVHTALNHKVGGHAYGNWDDTRFVIISPLQNMIEDNGKPQVLSTVDTWWTMDPGERIKFSNARMVRADDNVGTLEVVKNNNEYVFKGDNYTGSDLGAIMKMGRINKTFNLARIEDTYAQQTDHDAKQQAIQALYNHIGMGTWNWQFESDLMMEKLAKHWAGRKASIEILAEETMKEALAKSNIQVSESMAHEIAEDLARECKSKMFTFLSEEATKKAIHEMGFDVHAGGGWGWLDDDSSTAKTIMLAERLGIKWGAHVGTVNSELENYFAYHQDKPIPVRLIAELDSQTRRVIEAKHMLEYDPSVQESGKSTYIDDLRALAKRGEISWEEFGRKIHQMNEKVQKTMASLRDDIANNNRDLTEDVILERYLTDPDIPLERKKMIYATAVHMLEVRKSTEVLLHSIEGEQDRAEALKNHLRVAMRMREFEGRIEYRMIDGVLCIRCKSEADYAKFFGNLESHTSRGVALTAEETGMGVGMLIVKPDVELERENSVIAHELQHIYKQGSNHLEPEIERRNIFLERRRRGEWSPLTPQGEVDQEELNAFMRAEKEDCKRLLKDEVLAFLITHHISMEEVERSMTSESSHYNYFKESEEKRLIDAAIAHVESQAKDPMKLAFAVYDAFKKTKAEYAQESKQIMRDVVDTVKHLQQTGMSETEARAYLRDYLMFVPVDLWQFTLDKLRRSKIQKLESVG